MSEEAEKSKKQVNQLKEEKKTLRTPPGAASGARVLKTKKVKPACTQVHISVKREFHEAFLASLKKLRYKTQSEFYREKMREAIEEAERRREALRR